MAASLINGARRVGGRSFRIRRLDHGAPPALAHDIGKAPFGDVGDVVARAEQPTATDPGPAPAAVRPGLCSRPVSSSRSPARNQVALQWSDETEVQEVGEQHLPIGFHIPQKALPIDAVAGAQQHMGDAFTPS